MSCQEYIDCHKKMTEKQKNAMYDLWMTAVNYDGHAWVTYGDVEHTVAELLEDRRGEEE